MNMTKSNQGYKQMV